MPQRKTKDTFKVVMKMIFLVIVVVFLFGAGLSRADVHIINNPALPVPGGSYLGFIYELDPFIVLDNYQSDNWEYMTDSVPVYASKSYGGVNIASESGLSPHWYSRIKAGSSDGTCGTASAGGYVRFYVDEGDPVTLQWDLIGSDAYNEGGWFIELTQIEPEPAPGDPWPLARWGSNEEDSLTGTIDDLILNPGVTNIYQLEWSISYPSVDNTGQHDWATLTIDLSDSGTPPDYPEIDVTPMLYNFGDVEVGTSQTTNINISNTDTTAVLEFASISIPYTSPPGSSGAFVITGPDPLPTSLAPGANVDIEITFTPFADDPLDHAVLEIRSNDPDESIVSVDLYGCDIPPAGEPDIAVSPTSHDFGDVDTGSSQSTMINISNSGDEDLNISSITFTAESNTAFSITSFVPDVIAPGGNADVEITFAPVADGEAQAVLEISSDDPDESPVQINFSGTGVTREPDILLSPSSYYDFGDVEVGSSRKTTAWINNVGNADLTVSSIELSSLDCFEITSAPTLPVVIEPGQHVVVEITFSPSSENYFETAFQVSSDDPDSPLVQAIFDGYGVTLPNIVVSPISYDFENVEIGSLQSMTVNISNTGGADLNIDSIAFSLASSGCFSITAPAVLPEVIGPGGDVDIEITFEPDTIANYLAVLEIGSDDPDESLVQVNLSGAGTSILEVVTRRVTTRTKWIKCNIRPPVGHDVAEIDLSTIQLEGCFPVRTSVNTRKQIIVATFSGNELALSPGMQLLTATGMLTGGPAFEGYDYIDVINRGK